MSVRDHHFRLRNVLEYGRSQKIIRSSEPELLQIDWGDLGVDGWIILGWISRRWDVGIWTGLGWPRIETGGGRL